MNVRLERVAFEDKEVLRRLLELLRYDSSEHDGSDVNALGLFGYRWLDHYWTDEERHPFFIRAGGSLAGFALVRRIESAQRHHHALAEFFVMRRFRLLGVGREAAGQLFTLFPGPWRVHQEASNGGAQQFWRKVIALYTRGDFQEVTEDGWEGPVQEFMATPP